MPYTNEEVKLLDTFAATALPAVMSALTELAKLGNTELFSDKLIAKGAYSVAEAMLEERKKHV